VALVALPAPVVVALVALPAPVVVALVALLPPSTVVVALRGAGTPVSAGWAPGTDSPLCSLSRPSSTPCALAKCGVLIAMDVATLNESSISAKVASTALLLFFGSIRNQAKIMAFNGCSF
jgi:hypothetical protein